MKNIISLVSNGIDDIYLNSYIHNILIETRGNNPYGDKNE